MNPPDAASVDGPVAATPPPSRLQSGAAGVAGAAMALAVGQSVSGFLGSGPTLIEAVGTDFIDRFAATLKDLAVAIFGTNDKPALLVGIVVASLVLGAAVGVFARGRPLVAAAGYGGFGAVGGYALATDPRGGTAVAAISAASAIAAGVITYQVVQSLAHLRHRPVASADEFSLIGRRPVLIGAGTALVSAGGLAALSNRLATGPDLASERAGAALPAADSATVVADSQPFTVDGLSEYVTPIDDFYRIDTALSAPRVAVDDWELSVSGLVERPFTLSYGELLDMESVSVPVTIQCVSNEVGGDLIGTAVWQGVPLADLLDRARPNADAEQVVGRAVDDWTGGFPLADALDGRTAIVAYAMNGEPLPVEHGYPARLIVAGLYGYVSATKWLREIELTTWDDFDGYWVPRGWSKLGPIKTQCRIDVPGGDSLPAGTHPIAGVAWAPTRGIERVEVRIDGGEWRDAELGRVAGDETWVQWHVAWDAAAGDHLIEARATDGDGEPQTEATAPPAPDGATGYPRRSVTIT